MVTEHEIAEVEELVRYAFNEFKQNDYDLILLPPECEVLPYDDDAPEINRKLHEVCLCHRIAFYFECYLRQNDEYKFHVDLEYNRYYRNKKALDYGGYVNKGVRPDILIHGRAKKDDEGSLMHYLIVEAKKDDDNERDKEKIIGFLRDERYRYKFGLSINFIETSRIDGKVFYLNEEDQYQIRPIQVDLP